METRKCLNDKTTCPVKKLLGTAFEDTLEVLNKSLMVFFTCIIQLCNICLQFLLKLNTVVNVNMKT